MCIIYGLIYLYIGTYILYVYQSISQDYSQIIFRAIHAFELLYCAQAAAGLIEGITLIAIEGMPLFNTGVYHYINNYALTISSSFAPKQVILTHDENK